MSILVEGMKKPNICYEIIDGEIKRCPFLDAYDDCVILRKKGIWTGTTWAEQYSKCPLVEVPEPHGRLIEAPDVSEGEVFDEDTGTREISLWGLMECYRKVKDAKTVIEAEGEG